jgi:Kef-type K+ transport system membrane component KefB
MDHGASIELWLVLAAVILAAKAGGELAVRLHQPPVLGELLAGVLLGNLAYVGAPIFRHVGESEAVAFLAELGVVLLLFEVGLESTVAQMRRIGAPATRVAIIGVVVPMGLGFGVSTLLLPDAPTVLHLFIGATLCATSVGITARVLRDANAMQRPESHVVLGAAVLDDVLGLIVLAVVSAVAARGEVPPPLELGWLIGVAAAFLIGALLLGRYVMPSVFRVAARLSTEGVLTALAIGCCFLFAGASALAGLAPIVGAFAAGLVLDEIHVRPFGHESKHDLHELVRPVVAVLAPVFFVVTGTKVDLGAIGWGTAGIALALSVVAVAGKLVAGFGAPKLDWLTIGIGMVPRGEVGLIFASAGAAILVEGRPLIDGAVYAGVVLMVAATTLVAPPWLAWRLRAGRRNRSNDGRAQDGTSNGDRPEEAERPVE